MKGSGAASSHPPAKRRWTCFTVTVPVVVFLSLVGTVSVLLGLHNRFPTGYTTAEESSPLARKTVKIHGIDNQKEDEKRINALVDKFKPILSQANETNFRGKAGIDLHKDNNTPQGSREDFSPPEGASFHANPENINSEGTPGSQRTSQNPPHSNPRDSGPGRKKRVPKGANGDAPKKSCQVEFGSYCLWSKEHKEVMKDSVVKKLKDQLFVARSYYPSIAKLKGQEKLTQEMKQNIQDHERMLSEAISDPDLPSFVQNKIDKMVQTIAKAKSFPVECNNVDKKLRQILDLTEDEAHFHMKQSAFLHHLGVQTMPKSHHCLSMRLTVEYFRVPPTDIEHAHAHKLDNPSYQQYVIFSRNVLAVAVAINSTVMNSEESGHMVFNIITDQQNFYAMKVWFTRNSYKEAIVHVMNVGDLNLKNSNGMNLHQLSSSEEFRVSVHANEQPSPRSRTKYISIFGHSHFLLSDIFRNLKKVVVLDDDVVVQKDLSPLWDMDLTGKVNGALEFCSLRLRHLKSYLGNDQIGDSCVWMSGLNVIDLEKWRELNITGRYWHLLHKLHNENETSWRAAALPSSLLAFQDLIHPLDKSWVLSGLGYDYTIDTDVIEKAGVLHYNGNMKPWLDLGIPKYKDFWKKFLTKGELFMNQCNVNR